MKATIQVDVEDRKAAAAIRVAMQDPEVVAFVMTVGVLKPFSPRARRRILTFVTGSLAEARERGEKPQP